MTDLVTRIRDAIDALAHPSGGEGSSARARLELRAVLSAGATGAIALVIALVVLRGDTHPLAGDDSVARVAAFTTGGAAAASFALAQLRSTHRLPTLTEHLQRTTRACAMLAIALVTFGLGYLAAYSAGEVFQAGFVGLELDALGGALACAIAAGAAAYLAHPLGDDISTRTLGILMPTFLVVGVLFSMLTASNEEWWEVHFSELGADGGISGFAFNMTLGLSGVLVATLGGCVRADLDRITGRGERSGAEWVGRLLALIGACMVLTGIVRVDIAQWLHIGFAASMVVIFLVLCVGLPRLAPRLPTVVHVVSIAMVAGILVALVLWVPLGYYNFTGFEFAACGIIFIWLIVFVRALDAATADRDASDAAPSARDGASRSTSQARGGKVVA